MKHENEIELQVSCFRSMPAGSAPEAWNKIPYVLLYETIAGPFAENRDLIFRLIPYPTVTGKIVDPDGKPVVGASLRLVTSRRPEAEDAKLIFAHKEFDTSTDSDGVFQSMIAPDFDSGLLQCNAPGFVPRGFELKDLDPDKPDDWIFIVQRGVDVSGRLVDPEEKGIAGLWVNFQRSSFGTVNDPLGRSVKTDAEGRFIVSSLDNEEYRVNITPIPCCPNAENVEQVPRYEIPPTNEKFVFSHVSIDLRVKEGEEPKKREPLNIVGYPTVPFNFIVTDETSNGGALNYSRFGFHGQLPNAKETWSVQAKSTQEPGDRKRASGVSQLPKGSSVSISATLYGYVVKDGVGTILDEKQNWTLEYRFSGDTEWRMALESVVSGERMLFWLRRFVGGCLGDFVLGRP